MDQLIISLHTFLAELGSSSSAAEKFPTNFSTTDAGQLDNLCQLEETDDDEDVSTPVVENKPLTLAKITQV